MDEIIVWMKDGKFSQKQLWLDGMKDEWGIHDGWKIWMNYLGVISFFWDEVFAWLMGQL
jgi:hypothetical protein